MAQQARLDVFELQRLFEQCVVLQVDLSNRQVIGGSPIGVHLLKEVRR
jgi:hypothetical protein